MKSIALLLLLFGSSLCVDALAPEVHDPVMARGEDGRYYMFSTGMGVSVQSSADLKDWQREKPVLAKAPAWAVDTVAGDTKGILGRRIFTTIMVCGIYTTRVRPSERMAVLSAMPSTRLSTLLRPI